MKQQQFEAQHQQLWQRFDILLANKGQNNVTMPQVSSSSQSPLQSASSYEFIRQYRIICQHYALAKQRHYSPQLVQSLHDKVMAGHQLLYRRRGHVWSKMYHFYSYSFPVQLRAHANLFWLSLACFLVPAILMGWACFEHSDMLYSIMPDDQVRMMEEMYNPANEMVGRDSSRRSDTDIAMFGYYIQNNIGIDFQIYGMGLFAGLGTLLSLVYNGLVIGGVAGHLSGIGYGETFWTFVAGHSSFELTAAVISGAAGLRLAQSLFMPANYRRMDAFKIAGKQSIELLIGAASMTFIAAFIEAFWSSSNVIPDTVKYIVAALLWIMVLSYLLLAGKERVANMVADSVQTNLVSAKSKTYKPKASKLKRFGFIRSIKGKQS
ncbi:stage II sporulation protein M [Psychrobacter sp. I-STPA10]|uniref:stage II sporulation protein M n=1 Tax=Psychrobacter sp. I-STPA10 TaxID=2585769 RepID=UPI001E428FC1|nr:stage II sporulation protein M [Psychrobacter sp. I-STPA10]